MLEMDLKLNADREITVREIATTACRSASFLQCMMTWLKRLPAQAAAAYSYSQVAGLHWEAAAASGV